MDDDDRNYDDPIMDNIHLEYYNLDKKADEFVKYFRNMSKHYLSDHLIHTFGGDFCYSCAYTWYHNLDKLVIIIIIINLFMNYY